LQLRICDDKIFQTNLPEISLQVQNDLNNVIRPITNYVVWDSYTFDPIMEDLVKTIAQSIEEYNLSHDAITTSKPM
jgi:hypothetical protein